MTPSTTLGLSRHISEVAKTCLRDSPYKVFAGISCTCNFGSLLLQGRVSSFHLKQVAQEAVARVTGVTQVVNNIEVVRTECQRTARN